MLQLVTKDDYDVLVATDTIAEGFNLNHWFNINYDIPYNPTKVIQKLGGLKN